MQVPGLHAPPLFDLGLHCPATVGSRVGTRDGAGVFKPPFPPICASHPKGAKARARRPRVALRQRRALSVRACGGLFVSRPAAPSEPAAEKTRVKRCNHISTRLPRPRAERAPPPDPSRVGARPQVSRNRRAPPPASPRSHFPLQGQVTRD